jgi:hypothetical protein
MVNRNVKVAIVISALINQLLNDNVQLFKKSSIRRDNYDGKSVKERRNDIAGDNGFMTYVNCICHFLEVGFGRYFDEWCYNHGIQRKFFTYFNTDLIYLLEYAELDRSVLSGIRHEITQVIIEIYAIIADIFSENVVKRNHYFEWKDMNGNTITLLDDNIPSNVWQSKKDQYYYTTGGKMIDYFITFGFFKYQDSTTPYKHQSKCIAVAPIGILAE